MTRILMFIYFRILHRVEWNGNWGCFLHVGYGPNGMFVRGCGVEYLAPRWWAEGLIQTMERMIWRSRP